VTALRAGALTASLALACAAPIAEAPEAVGVRLQQAVALAQRGDCEAAAAAASELASSETLDAEQRSDALAIVATCTLQTNPAVARDAIARAEQLGAPWVPRFKFAEALAANDGDATLAAFDGAAAQDPGFVRSLTPLAVSKLFWLAGQTTDPDEAELRIHRSLADGGFRSGSTSEDGRLATIHVRMLLHRGDIAGARARLPEHLIPQLVLLLRTSALFAPLRGDPEIEAKLDYRKSAEQEVAIGVAEWEARPAEAAPLVAAMTALRALGRPREAMQLGERGLAAVEAAPQRNADESRRLILNQLAYSHYQLNEPQLARGFLERAAGSSEYGTPNVSQVINWANALVFESRPEEALRVLERLGRASPAGTMVAGAVRVCAYEQLGRVADRDAALAEMRKNEDDDASALSQALLCANQLDDAAALMVRRLSNDDQREPAFTTFHETQSSPVEELDFARLMHARARKMRDQPEVRRALEAVGTPEPIPLVGVYWGAF
jgi:tetratricopeptide (TPR) repeat protein